ncbi:50S ribosomal protein L7Ae [Candidatus Woesearchaeota archaeon]|nr:50S ribosomal protein L7Ae [Candidatus Woesearchaeota archaeon]
MAEVKKDLQDKAYEAIELAKKSGKLKKGSNEVTKSVEKGYAKLVVVANDVNPREVIMHLEPLSREKEIPFVLVESKSDLGAAAGLPVSTAAVAIIKEGDSLNLIKEIKVKLSKNGKE